MTKNFAQLLYVSRSMMPPDDEAGLSAILRAAARNNEALDLTGCLVSCGEWFVQILEGSPEGLAKAMERIQSDPNHTDITVRMRREVGTRSFANWRMAYLKATPGSGVLADPMNQPTVVLLAELLRLSEGGNFRLLS